MTERYFLGIDGGGSKTEFALIDADGTERAGFRTGPTYHVQVGIHGVERALVDGIAGVCAAAGVAPEALAYTFIGLPAYGEDSAVDPALDALCARLLGPAHALANDMVCGWAGSLGGGDGINLVAGTGSIGYGRRGEREARVGGWGELFSDEGSAHWIAVRGLNAFTRMSDGRLPPGPLHALVKDAFGLDCELDLCARTLGRAGMDRDAIAALAPLVSSAAADGDAAAAAIMADAARELILMATTLRTTLGYAADEIADLSWSGSVLANVGLLRNLFAGELTGQEFRVVTPRYPPAIGAARLAARSGGSIPARGSVKPTWQGG